MVVLIGLYVWGMVAPSTLPDSSITVPLIPAVAATVTLVINIILYFVTKTNKTSVSAFINYFLTLATLSTLVFTTGVLDSPYLSWLVIYLAFAGFFKTIGIIITLVLASALLVYGFLLTESDLADVVRASVVLIVPVLSSFLLWARIDPGSKGETAEDRSYHELASELSEVAGTSEVVINAITDGVIALNGKGTIELINPAAQQLLGWTKHDTFGLDYKSVFKMLDTKNQPVGEANDPVAQAISTNKAVKNDNFSLSTQSGKTFLASISVSPIGQIGNGVIVVFRDITTEKSDERQRAEFISTASHEMRTPVASIEGYLGLALNPNTATIDEKARDFINKAHESAQHLGRLFADLLDVSKADDSRLKNDPRIVDVVPFVHDIVEGLAPKGVEKGLHVIYKPIPSGEASQSLNGKLNPVYYANVDNDHLREVVQNLVENAIKYTPKGDVVVDVTGNNDHITISVTDTGIGIPREDQAHLFQKFYRVDSSDTREIGGTGLGLYLVRRLTETIGGRVWVESEHKKGSKFFVEIPRTSHDDAMHLIEQSSILDEQQAKQAATQPQPEQILETVAPAQVNLSTTPPPPVIVTPSPAATPVATTVVSQPAPTPLVSPLPAPTPSITPVAQTPATPNNTPTVPAPAQHSVNTPLSAIEANPGQYTTSRPRSLDITVPNRGNQ